MGKTHVKLHNDEFLKQLAGELLKEYLRRYPNKTSIRSAGFKLYAEDIEIDLGRIMSKKEAEKIGIKISDSTLERLIRGKSKQFHNNTLNKLSLFLGNKSWTDFKIKTNAKIYSEPKENENVVIKQKVREAIDKEIEVYKMLPHIDKALVDSIYTKGLSMAVNYFHELIQEYKKLRWILERSSFEFIDTSSAIIRSETAFVMTMEFLTLNWVDELTDERFEEWRINRYIYILEKSDLTEWKVLDKCILVNAFANPEKLITSGLDL